MAIVIGAEIRTDPDQFVRDLRRDAAGIEQTLGGAFQRVGNTASRVFSGISSVVGKVFSVRNLLAGGIAGYGLDQLIKKSTALDVQIAGLSRRFQTNEREIGRWVSQVNSASAGLLDFETSAGLVNQSLLLGIPPEAISRLVRLAGVLSVVKGDAGAAQQQIIQLLKGASGSFGFDELKRIGVNIGVKDVSGMSQEEARAFVLKETLRQLEIQADALGVSGRETFFQYISIQGSVKDIVLELTRAYTQSERFRRSTEFISKLTGNIATSLRENGIIETVRPVFLKLIELAGALAVDIGEAVAVGITRGMLKGLDLLGFKVEGLLGEQVGRRMRDFAANPTGFNRSRGVIAGLGRAFEQPDESDIIDPKQDPRGFQQALRRLREVENAIGTVTSSAFRAAVEAEKREADRVGESPDRNTLEGRALRRLLAERDELSRRTRGGSGRSADELRRIESELESGDGALLTRERRRAIQESRERGEPLNAVRDAEAIDREARARLEQRRTELLRQLGLGDNRTPAEKVDDQLDVSAGENLGQQLGKALVSGILSGRDELRTEVLGWFTEGFGAGVGMITLEVESWGKSLASQIVDAVMNADWMGIGAKIGAGLLSIVPGLGPAVEGIKEAQKDITEAPNSIKTILDPNAPESWKERAGAIGEEFTRTPLLKWLAPLFKIPAESKQQADQRALREMTDAHNARVGVKLEPTTLREDFDKIGSPLVQFLKSLVKPGNDESIEQATSADMFGLIHAVKRSQPAVRELTREIESFVESLA